MTNREQKIAFVTGCGRRVGNYLCHQLLDQGYLVHGHYRTERPELAELRERGVHLYQADFSDKDSILALSDTLITNLPKLDLLIHNASAFTPDTQQLADDFAGFEVFFRVHMLAPMAISRALSDALVSVKGNIIAITDIFVHEPNPVFATYCATKAGLDNLMRSQAKLLAPDVRVNTIEPGPILFLDEHDEEYRKQVLDKTPLAFEGGMDPIWQGVTSILSNPYMTGNRIKIDGGRNLANL